MREVCVVTWKMCYLLNDIHWAVRQCSVHHFLFTRPHLWHCRWVTSIIINKKHLKNVGPIHYCEPPHAHSPDVASGIVACRLRIHVHDNDDNDNAWQRGPLWPHGMGPITRSTQPCIPLGLLNRLPALIGWGIGGNITSAGCDPIYHVSPRSCAVLVAQTAICFLTLQLPILYHYFNS